MGLKLITKNLIIKKPTKEDVNLLIEELNNWEISKWLVRAPYPYQFKDAIEWLAQNKEQPYLQNIKNPDVKIFAQWDYGHYHLTYGEDRDGDILNDLSWGRFCIICKFN